MNETKGSGIRVQIYDYNGSAAQLWQLESAGGGYYYIKNKLGYYLDVYNASTANGAYWGATKKPLLSTHTASGCCAYACDFIKYVFGKNDPNEEI